MMLVAHRRAMRGVQSVCSSEVNNFSPATQISEPAPTVAVVPVQDVGAGELSAQPVVYSALPIVVKKAISLAYAQALREELEAVFESRSGTLRDAANAAPQGERVGFESLSRETQQLGFSNYGELEFPTTACPEELRSSVSKGCTSGILFYRLPINTVLTTRTIIPVLPCVQQALIAAGITHARSYALPPRGIIQVPMQSAHLAVSASMVERGKLLEQKLAHFGVRGIVLAIKPGPIITLYEYQPDINTKLSKITALEDDLAMALQAMSIRIIAPIPGRNAVGFEIANQTRESVFAAHIFDSDLFMQSKANLPIVLGVDISGKPMIEDLLAMPHLLVGGTTGSGKSVGVNAMLTSLILTKTPDELRLVLVDPKRLEFTPYADIPHLLFPIVTNPLKASQVLKWVVHEMEQRYIKMAEAGVRNILDYGTHVDVLKSQGEKGFERLPFIVVVIDELADLMMVAGKEVELYIVRLAQMARAAGIHMIVATQRPSVDVVTGIIKVNFPSRIAYRVSSKVDSRTILDQSGAEKLLGKGDLLFMHAASQSLQRIHGPYLTEKEIEHVTAHARRERKVEYLSPTVIENVSREQTAQDGDELYHEVLEFVKTIDEISISSLQRQYRIGFNRSARLIEQLEQDGLLAPAQGSKPRKVLH